MTVKTFRLATIAISIALAGIAAWAAVRGNYLAFLIAVVLAMLLSYSLRRATREVLRDERTVLLYGKASTATLGTVVPVAAVVSVVLVMLRERLPADVVLVAYTLSYASCALLLAQAAFYSYYQRKH